MSGKAEASLHTPRGVMGLLSKLKVAKYLQRGSAMNKCSSNALQSMPLWCKSSRRICKGGTAGCNRRLPEYRVKPPQGPTSW